MSERKSAEVKFRCTPTFKAGLQAAADAAEQSMSEYIEAAVWGQQNTKLDGTALVESAICWNVPPVESLLDADDLAVIAADATPDSDEDDGAETLIVPSRDDQHPACSCRPWEFCTHKDPA